ncbi:13163_t:CDS:2 [Entrophospora sp. SA101]|nr:13163_t:CDS:2 [Entrophospora sp. SA101]
MSQNPVIEVIHKLQEPMPQYVLGLIPVIVTLGAAPFESLKKGLYFRPVGLHVKDMLITSEQKKIFKNCTANASVLDRLSLLASGYYITVGTILGISSMAGQCNNGNWPFLTLSFLWTIPVIVRRTGIIVVKDPKIELKGHLIRVLEENEDMDIELAIQDENLVDEENLKDFPIPSPSYKRLRFIITTLFLVIIPWISEALPTSILQLDFFVDPNFLQHCALYGHSTIL